jgi:hypothetical protein
MSPKKKARGLSPVKITSKHCKRGNLENEESDEVEED